MASRALPPPSRGEGQPAGGRQGEGAKGGGQGRPDPPSQAPALLRPHLATPPLPARSASGPSPAEGGGGAPENLVLLGEFGRAHGLRGEVRLKSFTAEPHAIASYGPLLAADGRRFALRSVRPAAGDQPDLLVARVDGVGSREAAEALNRVRLFVPREKLPEPEEEEFLLADLVGLAVETASGERIGTVIAVPNYGGGDLLEIAPVEGPGAAARGRTALLPFTKAFVPTVDLPGRRLVADPPADLFEAARPPARAARPPAKAARPAAQRRPNRKGAPA